MTRRAARPILTVACSLLVALSCIPASAQSGRRPPPRRPDPPAPAPAPAPAPTPPPEDTGPKTEIVAGKYLQTLNIPSVIANYVLSACLDQLRQVNTFRISPGKDLNRKEAIDLAKSNEESFVLLLQFSIESNYDPTGLDSRDLRDIVVTYMLYEPKTAKVKTQGRVYVDASRYSNVTGRSPRGLGGGGRGYMPDEGGRKVAERVMEAFDVPTVPMRF